MSKYGFPAGGERLKNSKQIRVLIADDHQVVREGLVAIINRQEDMDVVAEAGTGPEAVEMYDKMRPDVSLLDLRMPGLDGLDVISEIRKTDPSASLVVLTTFDDEEDIYRSLQQGVQAYVLKDVPREELLHAIREVHVGRSHIPPMIASKLARRMSGTELTSRQTEVLRLMAEGKSNKEIAKDLFISEGTVKVHVNSILHKLGTRGRTEAVAFAVKRGMVRIS